MALDQALVGHESPRQTETVQAAEVSAFADAIGDANPLFHDAEAARAAGFAAALAPPTFVTSFRVPMAEFGLDPTRMQILHGEQEYEYANPLHAGEQLSVRQRLATLRQSYCGVVMAMLTSETIGETLAGVPAFTGRATVIVREGAPNAAAAAASSQTARPTSVPEGAA